MILILIHIILKELVGVVVVVVVITIISVIIVIIIIIIKNIIIIIIICSSSSSSSSSSSGCGIYLFIHSLIFGFHFKYNGNQGAIPHLTGAPHSAWINLYSC